MNDFNQRLKHEFHYANGTFRNKLHIKNQHKLLKSEYKHAAIVSSYLLKKHPKTTNIAQLFQIHKAMFGKYFPWAGKVRNYQLQKKKFQNKNGVKDWFQPSNLIPNGIKYSNYLLHKYNKKPKINSLEYANLLDNINYMHPFREGNGRSTKVFLQCLALNHGQHLEYARNETNMIKCLNDSNIHGIAKRLKVTNADYQPFYIKSAFVSRGMSKLCKRPIIEADIRYSKFPNKHLINNNHSINSHYQPMTTNVFKGIMLYNHYHKQFNYSQMAKNNQQIPLSENNPLQFKAYIQSYKNDLHDVDLSSIKQDNNNYDFNFSKEKQINKRNYKYHNTNNDLEF